MKIIVNNEKEKRLVELFSEMLTSGALDLIEEDDTKYYLESQDESILGGDDYRFLYNGFQNVVVTVDTKESALESESDIITGICVKCGEHTEGTLDGASIDYKEYLRLTDSSERGDWRCEACWNH